MLCACPLWCRLTDRFSSSSSVHAVFRHQRFLLLPLINYASIYVHPECIGRKWDVMHYIHQLLGLMSWAPAWWSKYQILSSWKWNIFEFEKKNLWKISLRFTCTKHGQYNYLMQSYVFLSCFFCFIKKLYIYICFC